MLFRPSAHRNLAYQVLHYVETHLEEPFTIRDISDEVGVSYFYLHHLFGETAGENLGQLIKRMRLEHAFGYLKHSGYTVGDIGDLTGFGSKHSFSRAFSQYFNQSPSKIRAQSELVVPDSFIHHDQGPLLTTYRQSWKQRMLDDQYGIRFFPEMTYFFQYLGALPAEGTEPFAQRLRRLFELQGLLGLPLVFSTSAIGCATRPVNTLIRAGFLAQTAAQSTLLKQTGFLQCRLESGNYLTACFEGTLPAGSVLTYSVIQESVREGLFQVRDHSTLLLINPARPGQIDVWIPVV
ncbi:helix-turn-helix transcriptional regulator [Larkinella sp. VNQ87]|uniref:helix-turn-helix transcriptional regulator n=1 Tax=Larkinella sp. VNQ87 TaxID=3400921 RepID=UPI003C0F4962